MFTSAKTPKKFGFRTTIFDDENFTQKVFFSSSKRQKKKENWKEETHHSLHFVVVSKTSSGSRRVALREKTGRERERERKREEETPEELRFCVPSSFLKYIETTTKKKKTPAALREREKKKRTNSFDAQREQKQGGSIMGGANGKKKKSPRGGKKQSATEKSSAARRGEKGHEGKDKMSKRNNDSEAASASALDTQIESALTHISYDRIEQGLKELKDICSKNPSSIDALETYAYALAEYGDQEDALDALRDAAKANPNSGYEKFMYLGQLLDDGKAATACTKKGLELLEEQMKKGDASVADRHCSACCALAEQILGCRDELDDGMDGDNTVDDDTANAVEQLLERAQQSDKESAEPMQVLASLRNEQGKKDEALKCLKQSIAKWRKPVQLVQETKKEREIYERKRPAPGAEDYVSSDDEDENEDEGDEYIPRFQDYDVSFEFRFETAKLLLEIDTSAALAIEILEELLEERDGIVDVWYLLAYAHYGANEFDDSLEIIEIGEKLAAKSKDTGALREVEAEGALMNFAELKHVIEEVKKECEEQLK